MKTISNIYAIISLVVANLIPLFGVVYYNWNVFSLMLLYWLENVIIGISTVAKMKKAEGKFFPGLPTDVYINGKLVQANSKEDFFNAKLFFIPFFSLHFGLFTLVHGVFVIAFFFSPQVSLLGVLMGCLSLCFSHYISYRLNFIDKGEYKTTSIGYLFISPYPRIFVMQFTVILGGMFALSNQTVYAGILLVVLKTITDLATHLIEHGRVSMQAVKTSTL